MGTVLTIVKLIASVVIAWLGYKSANSSGDADAKKQRVDNDAVQEKLDRIDAQKPDLDLALKRLHERAGNKPSAAPGDSATKSGDGLSS